MNQHVFSVDGERTDYIALANCTATSIHACVVSSATTKLAWFPSHSVSYFPLHRRNQVLISSKPGPHTTANKRLIESSHFRQSTRTYCSSRRVILSKRMAWRSLILVVRPSSSSVCAVSTRPKLYPKAKKPWQTHVRPYPTKHDTMVQ